MPAVGLQNPRTGPDGCTRRHKDVYWFWPNALRLVLDLLVLFSVGIAVGDKASSSLCDRVSCVFHGVGTGKKSPPRRPSLPSFSYSMDKSDYSRNRRKRTEVRLWPCRRCRPPSHCGAIRPCEFCLRHGVVMPVSWHRSQRSFWDVVTGLSTSKWIIVAHHDWSLRCLSHHARQEVKLGRVRRPHWLAGIGALIAWLGCRTTWVVLWSGPLDYPRFDGGVRRGVVSIGVLTRSRLGLGERWFCQGSDHARVEVGRGIAFPDVLFTPVAINLWASFSVSLVGPFLVV